MEIEKPFSLSSLSFEGCWGEIFHHRYRILRLLGRGGMGEVFLAEDLLEHRKMVALKMMKPGKSFKLLSSANFFQKEFELLRKLSHPYITSVYNFGKIASREGESTFYFTSQYISGHVWKDFESQDTFFRHLIKVVQALGYLHHQGFLHNDIKTSNILICQNSSQPYLIDFGLSHSWKSPQHSKQLAGTAYYIAPERIEGLPPSSASDLYSLGVLIYFLMTKTYPFRGANQAQVLQAHLFQTPIPPHQINPAVGKKFSVIIQKLLEKDPKQRIQSAEELLQEINRCFKKQYSLYTPQIFSKMLQKSPFVGRFEELQKIRLILQQHPRPLKNFIFLQGQEGVGKSRLLREIEYFVQNTEGLFLWDFSHSAVLWQSPLESFFQQIVHYLGPKHPLVLKWRGYFSGPSEGFLSLDQKILDLDNTVLDFLLECSQIIPLRVAIQIPSLHEKVDFLEKLFHKFSNTSLIFFFSILRPPPDRFCQHPQAICLQISPWGESETQQWLQALLPFYSKGQIASLAQFIHSKARGNPLLSEEIFDLLLENTPERISCKKAFWNQALLEQLPLDEVWGILRKRLLEWLKQKPIQNFLDLLAICEGEWSRQEFLQLAKHFRIPHAFHSMKTLLEGRVICEEYRPTPLSLPSTPKLFFRHPRIGAFLRSHISPYRQKILHKNVAIYLEKKGLLPLSKIYHFIQARQKRKLVVALEKTFALSKTTSEELNFLRIVKEAEKCFPKCLDIQFILACTYKNLLQNTQAIYYFEQILLQAPSLSLRFKTAIKLSQTYLQQKMFSKAAGVLNEIIRESPKRFLGEIYFTYFQIYQAKEDWANAKICLSKALDFPSSIYLNALYHLAKFELIHHRRQESKKYLTLLLKSAKKRKSSFFQILAHLTFCQYYQAANNFEEALESLEKAWDGLNRCQTMDAAYLCWELAQYSKSWKNASFSMALPLLSKARKIFAQLHQISQEADILFEQAQLFQLHQQRETALCLYMEAAQIYQGLQNQLGSGLCFWQIAMLYLEKKDLAKSKFYIEESKKKFILAKNTDWEILANIYLAWIALEEDDFLTCRMHLSNCFQLNFLQKFPYYRRVVQKLDQFLESLRSLELFKSFLQTWRTHPPSTTLEQLIGYSVVKRALLYIEEDDLLMLLNDLCEFSIPHPHWGREPIPVYFRDYRDLKEGYPFPLGSREDFQRAREQLGLEKSLRLVFSFAKILQYQRKYHRALECLVWCSEQHLVDPEASTLEIQDLIESIQRCKSELLV